MFTRRRFLQSAVGAAALWGTMEGLAADEDERLLGEARERIERHRRGPGTVVVRGHDGRPVPGARVEIEQLQHDFLFGCNSFRFGRIPNAQREDLYRERFAALLNYATLPFYWAAYEPERGRPQYEYTDRVAGWCAVRGITCKGHPLTWDYADPRWLPQEFSEIQRLSHYRVREIVARFQGPEDCSKYNKLVSPTDPPEGDDTET
jgi:hypothetical protein